ncbi:MAG: DUF1638 domain-containing protein [Chloroflexi bacterium]|nr:DUF1638 domain-containing protein [Chloroflexota bacterium]
MIGLIICGALGHEVVDLIGRHGWDAEIAAVPAHVHLFPEQIAPKVEQRILELRQKYERLIVVFGDCGSGGALDVVLAKYPDIERIAGLHCYEWYGGDLFQELLDEEPGTYFLTDFMVRGFRGTILKGMGLDKYPELREMYFQNYKRVVYLVQKPDPALLEQAKAAAHYLRLPLEIRATGYNLLEKRLLEAVSHKP